MGWSIFNRKDTPTNEEREQFERILNLDAVIRVDSTGESYILTINKATCTIRRSSTNLELIMRLVKASESVVWGTHYIADIKQTGGASEIFNVVMKSYDKSKPDIKCMGMSFSEVVKSVEGL